MSGLGKLERISDIRGIWPGEASHFTPWLAQSQNIALLAEALGYGADGLSIEAVELNIGAFRADILARETGGSGGRVLIENQYGKTNHDHLGKIVTYASGLKATTVVLLAEEIREEHRSALDWLNAISNDEHQFFGVALELWRIGDSLPAPRFDVIVKPNDWERLVDSTTRQIADGLGETGQLYIRYWAALANHLKSRGSRLRARKPFPQQWTGFAIGRTGIELNAFANVQANWIRAELTLSGADGKNYFRELLRSRPEIDAELGFAADWEEQPERKQSRISITRPTTNLEQESDWPNQHEWLADKLERMDETFRPRLAAIAMIL